MPDAVTDDSRSSAVANPPANGGTGDAAAPAAGNPGAPGANVDDDASRNWRALRGDRDYWRDRATQLETTPPRRDAAPTADPNPPPASDSASPKKTLADFNFNDAAYSDYLEQRAIETARKTTRDELAADQDRKLATDRREKFVSREAEFVKTNPTYHEAVRNPRFVQSPALMTELEESEEGPAIALFLANNLDQTNRLNRLDPVRVAREVVRLEATVKAERAALKNQMPGGGDPPPNPPPKIEGAGDAGVQKDPAKMSDDDWWKNRQRTAKRK